MPLFCKNDKLLSGLQFFFILILIFSSCSIPIVRKTPEGKPFLRKNNIEVTGGKFTATEKSAVIQRLSNQLEDSARIPSKDFFVLFNIIKRPPVYDTAYSGMSARNMKASMFNLGYYSSKVTYRADTSNRKVHVHYLVEAGRPTLIDTVSYRMRKPDLQQIAIASKNRSILVKDNPITKAAVLGEISRLVDSFRNNGYYKFTAAELRVRGDTTIEALTTISEDPFEQLRLLAEAQQKADSPQIRLSVTLIPPTDTSKLQRFYINRIFILSDFHPSDNLSDTTSITQRSTRDFILRYHERLFRTGFLSRNITFKSGELYSQAEYYKTLNNLSKAGVWESANIQIMEVPDSSDKINMIIELIPGKKFGFEAALEASYSASIGSASIIGGNLFGISGNLSLTNRNVGKEAISMTHKIRAGIELNNNNSGTNKLINSNEIGYSNNILFPRLIFPELLKYFTKSRNVRDLPRGESFINSNISYSNRLDLFDLQSLNVNIGWSWLDKHNFKWEFRPLNLGFSYLYNETPAFLKILDSNLFLKYSYTTAYVVGMGASVSNVYYNPKHLRSLSRERSTKINLEESGITWANLGILKKYLRRYVKVEAEYKYTISYPKTGLAFRFYTGVGIPLLGSDSNRTLPFFKQYFGGGSNSMRGWPIRGIGIGGQAMAPYNNNSTFYNNRTGDIQLEGNVEYRYDIARIIPNTLTLRGALFIDAGNIWNTRNSKLDGTTDTTQFKFENVYRQLGLSAGTGFRLDFNYFVVRFDLGFRFKRPELYYVNSGWKAPSIGFSDFLPKIFTRGPNGEYRKWRYENFNFTIGISYPF
ncbi:MAG: BamA/TamA family outer membrane protein [Ferruginibacter sp.]